MSLHRQRLMVCRRCGDVVAYVRGDPVAIVSYPFLCYNKSPVFTTTELDTITEFVWVFKQEVHP